MSSQTQASAAAVPPRTIQVHPADNVAIVVNDGGLPAGSVLPGGLTLVEAVPQGHKVALADLAEGEVIRRYNVVIGYAARALPRGSWVNERVMRMPTPPGLEDLPVGTLAVPAPAAIQQHTSRATAMPMARWARATSWP